MMKKDSDSPPSVLCNARGSDLLELQSSTPSHLLKVACSEEEARINSSTLDNAENVQVSNTQMSSYSGSVDSGYTPPTPPNTPKKSGQQAKTEQDLMKASIENRFNDARTTLNREGFSRLSPLTITTDFQPSCPPGLSSVSPYIQTDPNCLTSPLIVNLPIHNDMDEDEIKRKREFIAKVLEDAIHDSYPSDVKPKDIRQDLAVKPFPLQDPPRARFKRQISTDSNDSADIKYFEKSPTKRLQSVTSQSSNESQTEEWKQGDSHVQVKCRAQLAMENTTVEIQENEKKLPVPREIPFQEKPYANNVRWVLNTNDPSPSKEEDFHEIKSHEAEKYHFTDKHLSPNSVKPQDFMQITNNLASDVFQRQSNSLKSGERFIENESAKYKANDREWIALETQNDFQTKERSIQMSEEDLHRDMFQYLGRDAKPHSSVTTTSARSGQLVSEKGFYFPNKATVREPYPFSPRIVSSDTRPQFKSVPADSMGQSYGHPFQKSPTSRPAMSPAGRDRKEEQGTSYIHKDVSNAVPNITQNNRRVPLRSNSDIDHSPSKKEIEEIKRYVQSMRRSISDPSATPPKQKEMLREERMRESLTGSDDVFSEENLSHAQQFNRQREQQILEHENKLFYEQMMQFPGMDCVPQPAPYDAYQSRYSHDYRLPPVDVKRKLFLEGNPSPSSTNGRGRISNERRGIRNAPREQIPDHIARFLISRNMCTPSDIVNFNERSTDDSESSYSEQNEYSRRGWSSRSCPENPPWYRYSESENDGRIPNTPASAYSTPPQRRRNRGEVDVRLTCTDIALKAKDLQESLKRVEHNEKNCFCSNVENEILNMARDAYKKIRRYDDSKKSFEQFENELQGTNNKIFDAMNVLCSIKSLCKHGRTIEGITTGSVVFRVYCPTSFSLRELWQLCKSGRLEKIFNEAFVSDALREKYPDIQIYLNVEVYREQFERALKELDSIVSPGILDNSLSKSDTEIASINSDSAKENLIASDMVNASQLSVIHIRSHSAPITQVASPVASPSWISKSPKSPLGMDRKFFPSTGEKSPRRAMKEINMGMDVPCSPTMKKLFDFDLNLSPTTSPKRKTFEGLPWEHENYNSDVQSPKRKNFGNNVFPLKDKSNDV